MSVFSEYFNKMKTEKNISVAEIADLCDKDRSMIFYWSTGKKMPENWKQLSNISEKLQLSVNEEKKLFRAYERTKYGEENYWCYQKIFEICHTLQRCCQEYKSVIPESAIIQQPIELPEMLRLNNKLEILQWVQKVLEHIKCQKEKNIYLKMEKIHPEVWLLLKMFCSQVENLKITLIIYLQDNPTESLWKNLDVLKDISEILLQKNEIKIYSKKMLDIEGIYEKNWILSDDFILQYNGELSDGILITQPQWITFFKKDFQEMTESGKALGKKEYLPETFNTAYDLGTSYTGSSIEYMPCVGPCLERDILENSFYEDLPDREDIIYYIMKNAKMKGDNYKVVWQCFCYEEGLQEFMNTGFVGNFPHEIYRNFPMEYRCRVLKKGIELMKEGLMNYYFCRKDKMQNMKYIHIEQVKDSNPRLIIYLYPEKGKKEHVVIQDANLQQKFEDFFEYLKDAGYVYDKEESLKILEDTLEEYTKKI